MSGAGGSTSERSAVYRALAGAAHAVEPAALSSWRKLVVATARDDTVASESILPRGGSTSR